MSAQKKLITQLFPSFLLITFASLLIVTWYVLSALDHFYIDQTRQNLVARAHLVRLNLPLGDPAPPPASTVDDMCREMGRASKTRITVILPTGLVIGDSDEAIDLLDNHAGRPEVRQALTTGLGSAIRYSDTLETNMMYVAVPILEEERPVLIVRTAVPLSSVYSALGRIKIRIVAAGLIVALLVIVVSYLASQKIVRPIREMKVGADRFAAGDFNLKLPLPNTVELAGLAAALNDMAGRLSRTIRTIQRQKNELEAVFASMTEAVMAVDNDDQILLLNRTAERFLGCREADAKGKRLYEIIRNHDFNRFAKKAAASDAPDATEHDIEFEINEKIHIINTGSAPLVDGDHRRIGTLLVLSDVTRVRQLENMRKEFAANVSHEIRTPLTAIKGFAEALLSNPALSADPEAARHLDIVLKNAERLSAIVEDVLRLSHIEHGDKQTDFNFTTTRPAAVIDSAVNICNPEAERKNIRITSDCDPDLTADLDFSLMEQALVNLLANAVKYSPDNSTVDITVSATDQSITIRFTDNGPGIEEKHLSRLFERFYRVDQARSRKLGGTGLGLAIVKHVVQAHEGTINVSSTPGQGSTFTVILPRTSL